MVDVLMLASQGSTYLADLLTLSTEYDVVRKERTQSFFSDRTIYDSTAYTLIGADGEEAAYLGRVTVAPSGRLGFAPSVVLSGDVPGGSFHNFLAGEIAAHHDGGTIWANLLSGEDVVVGDGSYSELDGFDGNDVIVDIGPGAQPDDGNFISGGNGDDLIFMSYAYCSGDAGSDTFIAVSSDLPWHLNDFEHGVDKILFDRTAYADIGTKITRDSFHIGSSARDADDRLIVEILAGENYARVYVDPDGVGGDAQYTIGGMYFDGEPSFRDFGMVDAAKLMPDISKLFDRGGEPDAGVRFDHAFGGANAVRAGDDTPLVPHGLIQLA